MLLINTKRSITPRKQRPPLLPPRHPVPNGSRVGHVRPATVAPLSIRRRNPGRGAEARAGRGPSPRLDKQGPAPLSWALPVLRAALHNTIRISTLTTQVAVVLLVQRLHVHQELRRQAVVLLVQRLHLRTLRMRQKAGPTEAACMGPTKTPSLRKPLPISKRRSLHGYLATQFHMVGLCLGPNQGPCLRSCRD